MSLEFNIENIEKSVLSTIIYDNTKLDDLVDFAFKKSDFSKLDYQNLYQIMIDLSSEDTPIDEEFMLKKLPKYKLDSSILLDVMSTTPVGNFKKYIEEIRTSSLKREIKKLSLKTIELVEDDNKSAEEISEVLQKSMYEITEREVSKDNIVDINTAAKSTLKIMESMKEQKTGLIGVDTGYKELNNMTSGFKGGELIILAARPAMGKTAFALNMTRNMIRNNTGVIFFSLEMSPEDLMMRMLALDTSIPLQKIKTGMLDDSEWGQIADSIEEFSDKKFFIYDGELKLSQTRSTLRKLTAKHNIDIAIIDYIGLMDVSVSTYRERHLQVGEISRGLKVLARELDIPIIALSQLSRTLENRDDKRPMLSDLRDSGSVEQDADLVMFVYREDVYKEHEYNQRRKRAQNENKEFNDTFDRKSEQEAEIIIGKQRNGPIGTIRLTFHTNVVRFMEKVNTNDMVIRQSEEGANTNFTPPPADFSHNNTPSNNAPMLDGGF